MSPTRTCLLALMFSLLTLDRLAVAAAPEARVSLLARGINIPHWMWLAQKYNPDEVRAYLSADEAKRLRDAGFTHVRLPIDPLRFATKESESIDGERGMARVLLDMVSRLTGAGLGVVIDVHPMGTRATHLLADSSPDWAANLERFWSLLAPVLATTDPDRVILELLNEPNGIKDKAEWPRVQQRLLSAVRRACPNHTIMLTGDDYGGIDGLLRLMPVDDSNVIYSFHFYESHTFTHQGATWGAPFWKFITTGVPYPSTPELVEHAAANIEHEQARGAVRWYGKERWNREKIAARINEAAAWAKKHHVIVYCGEFGVIRNRTPRESRLSWLADVTGACREAGIGWAMWDYAGGFALADGEAGMRRLDDECVKALMGLKWKTDE